MFVCENGLLMVWEYLYVILVLNISDDGPTFYTQVVSVAFTASILKFLNEELPI